MQNSYKKPKPNTRVSQRIPKEMDADLKELSRQLGIRRAQFVREALAERIQQVKEDIEQAKALA